ncbi:TonB-dependent siderophore receptor [Stenotrophomonas rhizophila]|uniref:TonB-dependent siderophore receptor n=1 Tax=Stenotrophomonas rhizophila TaxID=216778 RepID=UPI00201CDB5D|nr:TonB-dependent siderophore receptor [Stenotrophomonas rhizophila]UQY86197.1 TonB-dependent siderophore receptor [Stenotrophomonas rhizophila]
MIKSTTSSGRAKGSARHSRLRTVHTLLAGALLAASHASAEEAKRSPVDTAVSDLDTVKVEAQRLGTTEGTGSYTSPVVTWGGKAPVPVLDIPNSMSVITRQRIEDQNLVTVEDALREVTGVTVTPWDGATSQIRSRGYNLESSYDGIPAYGALSAFQQFDLAIYDRVEVLRGPGGIFQGSGQPGGVANFVRKRGREAFGGSIALSAGSWSNYRGEVDIGGPLDAAGRVRSRFIASAQERDYFYETADSSKRLFHGTLDWDLAPSTTVSLSATHQTDDVMPYMGQPAYTDQRFLGASRALYVYPDWVIQQWDKEAITLDLEHLFDNGWSIKGRASRQRLDWYYKDSYPTGGVNPERGTVASYARRQSDSDEVREGVDLFAAGAFQAWGRDHHATIGATMEEYESTTRYGQGPAVRDVPVLSPNVVPEVPIAYTSGYHSITRQSGLYGQLRLALTDRLTGVIGGRWSNFEVKSRSVSPQPLTAWVDGAQAHGEFTPYAGAVFHFSDTVTAYASYADTFIPQTQRKVSGETIDPRIGKQLEIGAKASVRGGALNLAAAAFQTKDVNRSYPDVANPGFFLQAGEVEVKGWEVEASGSPWPNLDLTAGYTRLLTRYVRHQTIQEGSPFTLFEPDHTLKLFANYRIETGALRGLSLGGGLHASSGILGTGVAGVREQRGYAVASAHAGYRFTETLQMSVAVNNLFDRHYFERVGGLNSYNTPGEPRNVLVTLRSTF